MASSVNSKQRVPILLTLTTCSNGRLLIPPNHRFQSPAPPRLPSSVPHFSHPASPPSPSSLSLSSRAPASFSNSVLTGIIILVHPAADSHSSSLPRLSLSLSSLLHPLVWLTPLTRRHPSVSDITHRVVMPIPPPSFPPSLPLG